MELTSESDYRLLRNIICVKKVFAEAKSEEQKEAIEIYNNLLYYLNSGNTSEVNRILSTSQKSKEFLDFSQSIATKSSKDLSYEYISLIKSLNLPKDKFSNFLEIFFKNNEELNPNNEGIEPKKIYLSTIHKLLKRFSKKGSPRDFKDFANSFAINSIKLAKEIYKSYFNEHNQELLSMRISYGKGQNTYVTLLSYHDNNTNTNHTITLEEIAPPSDFACTNYQNLCCACLKPATYSKADDNLVTPNFIQANLTNFKRYYEGIKSMSDCKIAILNGKLMCYDETYKTPSQQPEKLSNEYEER